MTKQTRDTLERPPVVVVVGHVDHGKTALLDYIRKTNIVTREAGGITQSIGAYEAEHNDRRITFIDTPGHEAFSQMRAYGAQAADLAILVVAAEEGVKPQTKEAIETLKRSETPYIVAITKVDKPEANIEKVKSDLLSHEVLLEGMGGDVSYQPISSKTGEGIDDLLDLVLLMSDVLELRYDPHARARGFVIESCRNSRRGIEAHVIVTDGMLRQGEDIVTITAKGKIKALEDFAGKRAKELYPSAPALIIGFETMPRVGEVFVLGDVGLLEAPSSEHSAQVPAKPQETHLSKTEAKVEHGVNVVLKADSSGSAEALQQLVQPFAHVVECSVGDISDGEVQQAISTGSVILGFHVKTNKAAMNLAKIHNIPVFTSNIIYALIDELRSHIKTVSGPCYIGTLKVLKVFGKKEGRRIIGGVVSDGCIRNAVEITIFRAEKEIGTGKIVNLQREKDDVQEVSEGKECGLLLDTKAEVQEGDLLKMAE
jgi:translation initiation factor IF-2